MEKPKRRIDDLTIDTPCPVPWDTMVGDHKVRFCDLCHLNVYNLTYFTETEIEDLIDSRTGARLCGSMFRRPDGTIVTDKCPAALRKLRDRGVRLWQSVAGAMSFVLSISAGLAQSVTSQLKSENEQAFERPRVKSEIEEAEWAEALSELKAGHFLETRTKLASITGRDQSLRAEYLIGLCCKAEGDYSAAKAAFLRACDSPEFGIRRKARQVLNSIYELEKMTQNLHSTISSGGVAIMPIAVVECDRISDHINDTPPVRAKDPVKANSRESTQTSPTQSEEEEGNASNDHHS